MVIIVAAFYDWTSWPLLYLHASLLKQPLAYQKMEEKKGRPKKDYAKSPSAKQCYLAAIWTGIVFWFFGSIVVDTVSGKYITHKKVSDDGSNRVQFRCFWILKLTTNPAGVAKTISGESLLYVECMHTFDF